MEKIKINDINKFKFLSNVKYSPDGLNACFVVHTPNEEDNKYNSNIWIYKVEEEEFFQLTNSDAEASYFWKDNSNILFKSSRSLNGKEKNEDKHEKTQFYKINIHGGEAIKSFKVPKHVGEVKFINEEECIFTASNKIGERELYTFSDDDKSKEVRKRKEDEDYQVFDEIPYWGNGEGFTNKQRSSLYRYNFKTEKISKITQDNIQVEYYKLNDDATKVVLLAETYENISNFTNEIYIYDVKNDELNKVDTFLNNFSNFNVNFLSNGNLLSFATNQEEYGLNENGKFYIIDLNTKETKCITPKMDLSLWNSIVTDCRYSASGEIKVKGDKVYFVSLKGYNTFIFEMDLQGNFKVITEAIGTVDSYDVYGDEILFVGMRGKRLEELYTLKDRHEKRITSFNEWVVRDKYVVDTEKLEVRISDDSYIDGWVMKPVGFEKGKKYPAILDIHGGPKAAFGEVFMHEMQYWANEGYFVFYCNPRGGDGKGNEFADIRGKYGTIDYEDIMKFTDEVLNKYSEIDVNRVAVTGGSYGGFMTNWIIGHTDRFKAAASQRSISNWISFFNTSDIGWIFGKDQCAGDPWNETTKLWEASPLKYADKVKTPTLFIHSDEDYRCWLAEGLQMFTAVKYHGVESRMCIFKEENHELSRSGKPKHRIRRLREITDWFEKYLK